MARASLEPQKINLKESFSSLKTVPRFFREIRSVNPKLFFFNILARVISAFLPLAMLFIGKLIVDEVLLQVELDSKNFKMLWILVATEFFLAISSDLLRRAITYTDALLGDQYSIRSSVAIIKKTNEIRLADLEDADFYDKMERARRQTTGRVALMSNVLSQGEDIIVIISLLAGLIAFEPWLIILLVLSVIPTILNEIKFSGTGYSLARSWTQERRELDYLRYAGASDLTAKEVKLFGLSGYIADRFKKLSDVYYLASKKLAGQRARWGSIFNLLGTGTYYGAYVIIVYRTALGILSLGDLTFLSGSFNRLRGRLQGFFTRFTAITERALYLQDYFDFLDMKFQRDDRQDYLPMPKEIKEGFEFDNVGFRYPNTEKWVVRGLSFNLKAGEKLAFVGENGAGKTTLIKLMLGFYQATEGEIRLDGVPIQNYEPDAYQAYFGVIFQDFVKFELTLKENIAVGSILEIENEKRILDAADRSLANQVIDDLPGGINQQLGKRFKTGKDLSGGQWQKVAMARAYMKDAPVMILDEPTSALDARAEAEAFDRFIKLSHGKTAVIISHRFSTVRIADRILVLKNGKALELGSHEELMAKDQLYAELFRLQAAGYQ